MMIFLNYYKLDLFKKNVIVTTEHHPSERPAEIVDHDRRPQELLIGGCPWEVFAYILASATIL